MADCWRGRVEQACVAGVVRYEITSNSHIKEKKEAGTCDTSEIVFVLTRVFDEYTLP